MSVKVRSTNKERVNAWRTMELSTPSKKPPKEAHSSPRSVAGLVLEEPEDGMHELEQEALETEQPKSRMQELEEKRLALRRKSAHLQQRLHEFSARSHGDIKSKSMTETTAQPSYTVENICWQDEHGNEATYTGPLNAHKLPHGPGGRMVYEDGSVVEGDFQDGKPHGEASYKGSDGCTFEGGYSVCHNVASPDIVASLVPYIVASLIHDTFASLLRNTVVSLASYLTHFFPVNSLGGFQNGMKCGYGYETWKSGSSYKGEYVANMRNGRGVYRWADGQIYDGEWQANNRFGKGCHHFVDGRCYAGEWKYGLIEGKGVFTWCVHVQSMFVLTVMLDLISHAVALRCIV